MPEDSPGVRPAPRSPRDSPAQRLPRTAPSPGFVIDGAIEHSDLADLERRMRACLETLDSGVVDCDVERLARVDAVAVDVLARLQVLARRDGRRIRLVSASPELRALLGCMGLTDALSVRDPSGRGLGRQAEEREQAGRVEKEADPDDPSA